MTAIEPLTDRLDSARTRAATWAPVLALLLAMLYALGYLVISTYVGAYGVRDFEPLRTRYVAAGLTFCVLCAVIISVGVRVLESVLRVAQQGGRRRFLSGAAFPAALVAVTLTAVYLLVQLRATGVGIGQLSWSYVGSVFSFSTGALVLALIVRNRRDDWHTWFGTWVILGSLTSLVLALLAYATVIYPSIPTWLGGGKPDAVELVLDDPVRDCPPCVGRTLLLIDDDSGRIVILIEMPDGSRQAAEISRSRVRAILHSRSSEAQGSGP